MKKPWGIWEPVIGYNYRISLFDESIRGVQVKDCTYRIYRDTRFSQDKTPYKTHLGGYINARGKKSDHCGYYVHIEPGNCLLAGGSYCLPPKTLKAVRQAVYDNIDEFRGIVENPDFKQYFPVIGEDFLKTAPKGFPKDFEYVQYLKCKEYTCYCNQPDSFFSGTRLCGSYSGNLQANETFCWFPELHDWRLWIKFDNNITNLKH